MSELSSPSRFVYPTLLSLSLLLASACGDDDGGSEAIVETTSCVPRAMPCDIRKASCRQAVFAFTACMRGQPGATAPESRIITRQQYADETRADLAQRRERRTPESTRESESIEEALRLLAFLPPEQSLGDSSAESSINAVAAYYDHSDKAITVIEDSVVPQPGASIEEAQAEGTYTLAHEYVHALQDQRENLQRLSRAESSTDGSMAVDSLVEGEAVLLSDLVMFRAVNDSTRDALWVERQGRPRYQRMRDSMLESIAESAAPLTEAQLMLPYPIGAEPLAEVFLDDGLGGVRALYRTRPSTLIGWVERGSTTRLPTPLRCSVPNAPEGYASLGLDSFGGTGLIALYTRLGLDGTQSFEAAKAWTNDRIALYAPAAEEVAAAIAWRIGLRDVAAASDLERLVRSSTLKVEVTRDEREVLLTGASNPAVLASWVERDACRVAKGATGEEPTTRFLPELPHRHRHVLTRASVGAR